ncbi:membrane metallo-endopeptidase-like 1 isoform X2 [Prorops nasuta]|uniref:membrane metallo-endopeptidase-like 1 isoform X2 n=1 Tax=Prorops nasuta TaxID=863751 RepID=UPI0034CFA6B9
MSEITIFLLLTFLAEFALGTNKSSIHCLQHSQAQESYVTCKTERCREIAQELKSGIDFTVDPCKNFYKYACGNWLKTHPIPPKEVFVNNYQRLLSTLRYRISDILNNTRTDASTEALKKARYIYKSCENIDARDRNGASPLSYQLTKIGDWPLLHSEPLFSFGSSWQSVLKKSFEIRQPTALFEISVVQDLKNSSSRIISITQPTTILPRTRLLEVPKLKKQIELYKKFITDVALHLRKQAGKKRNAPLIHIDINEMIEFELGLARIKVTASNNVNIEEIYSGTTIEQFQDIYDSHRKVSSVSKIDWSEIIELLFNPAKVKIKKSEMIDVADIEFFKQLPALLMKTRPRTIVNYIIWTLILYMIDYSDSTLIDIRDEFYSNADQNLITNNIREPSCLTQPNLEKAISFEYITRYMTKNIKGKVQKIVDHILKVAEKVVSKISWMDEVTREKSAEKVRYIKTLIGYPDFLSKTYIENYYKDFKLGVNYLESIINIHLLKTRKKLAALRTPFNRDEWDSEPTDKDASYKRTQNALTITAAMLQYPIFDPDRPEFLNYATIGNIAAHEISHAFDVMGHKFDKLGNLKNWWSPHMFAIYKEKAKCFIDQFSKFLIPELSKEGYDTCVNGEKTVSENIADSAALQVSYDAHEDFKSQNGGIDVRLEELETHNSDKLFFVQFARLYCRNLETQILKNLHLNDCHATSESRVIGSVSNHRKFPSVFNCDPGTPMNPIEKCSIL